MKHSRTLISFVSAIVVTCGLTLLAVNAAGAQDTSGQAPSTKPWALALPGNQQQNLGPAGPDGRIPPMMVKGASIDQMIIDGRSIIVAYEGRVVRLNKDDLKVEAQVILPGSTTRPVDVRPPQPSRLGGDGVPSSPLGGGNDQPNK